jgi:hypothetical protein
MMSTATLPARGVTSDEALRVARADAENVYRDLHEYRIEITLDADGWHIDYELRDADAQGGGPHYVIDVTTGAIVSKVYYQ